MGEPPSLEQRRAALETIAGQIKTCTRCPLGTQGRINPVPGAGPTDAEIMFIGEGPGYYEDKQGLPFVGNSGKYLEELLAVIGINRRQVFITNVVKCRPPENRDPTPDEVKICTGIYLFEQIALINPKVIVTLGRYSMGLFFTNAKITAIHGQPKWQDGRAYLPLFHPAAVLRNPGLRGDMEADFKKIPVILAEFAKRTAAAQIKTETPPKPPEEEPPPPPEQLKLF